MAYPAKYRYTREHEWIEINGKTGKVGITDYAQQSLGDIVFVDLPKIGSALEQGKVFGSVESVKAVSDLFTPIGGEVLEINDTLENDPAAVNRDPYGAGWLFKVKLADANEKNNLLSAADYEKIATE